MRDKAEGETKGGEEATLKPQRKSRQKVSETVEVSFKERTQSTESPEVPTTAPGSGKGPNEITSSLGETVECI